MQPTVGRIVHFRETADAPCQAAVVVRVWSPEVVNLVVFRDGTNDRQQTQGDPALRLGPETELTVWRTSIAEASEHQLPENPTWHWPEREEAAT